MNKASDGNAPLNLDYVRSEKGVEGTKGKRKEREKKQRNRCSPKKNLNMENMKMERTRRQGEQNIIERKTLQGDMNHERKYERQWQVEKPIAKDTWSGNGEKKKQIIVIKKKIPRRMPTNAKKN